MQSCAFNESRAVSPVIATILLVAITVVLAAVLVVYMNSVSENEKPENQSVILQVTREASGDYTLRVTSETSGNFAWADAVFCVKDVNQIPVCTSPTTAGSYQAGVYSTGAIVSNSPSTPSWYIKSTTDPSSAKFNNGTIGINAADGVPANIARVVNAYWVVLDLDGNGCISVDDIIRIFANPDNNGTMEILPNALFTFKDEAGKIRCEVILK